MTLKEEIKWLLIAFACVPPIILLFAIFINLADIRLDLAMFPMMKHKMVDFWYTWKDIFNLMLLYLCVFPFVILYRYIKHKRKKMR